MIFGEEKNDDKNVLKQEQLKYEKNIEKKK